MNWFITPEARGIILISGSYDSRRILHACESLYERIDKSHGQGPSGAGTFNKSGGVISWARVPPSSPLASLRLHYLCQSQPAAPESASAVVPAPPGGRIRPEILSGNVMESLGGPGPLLLTQQGIIEPSHQARRSHHTLLVGVHPGLS